MKKQKDILYILIPSFILLVFWIGFTIYNGAVSSTITEVQQVNIKPIAPSFDTATINELKKRKKVTPQNEAIIITEEANQVSPSLEPEISPSTPASDSVTLEEETP